MRRENTLPIIRKGFYRQDVKREELQAISWSFLAVASYYSALRVVKSIFLVVPFPYVVISCSFDEQGIRFQEISVQVSDSAATISRIQGVFKLGMRRVHAPDPSEPNNGPDPCATGSCDVHFTDLQ